MELLEIFNVMFCVLWCCLMWMMTMIMGLADLHRITKKRKKKHRNEVEANLVRDSSQD